MVSSLPLLLAVMQSHEYVFCERRILMGVFRDLKIAVAGADAGDIMGTTKKKPVKLRLWRLD